MPRGSANNYNCGCGLTAGTLLSRAENGDGRYAIVSQQQNKARRRLLDKVARSSCIYARNSGSLILPVVGSSDKVIFSNIIYICTCIKTPLSQFSRLGTWVSYSFCLFSYRCGLLGLCFLPFFFLHHYSCVLYIHIMYFHTYHGTVINVYNHEFSTL